MRVAMYYNNRDVRLEEIPPPTIGSGELLVKVMACGICGSDVMEWYRIKKAPRVLGHEIAGEIVEVGKGVLEYKINDRVFVSHHVPCNTCRYCLNGHHTVCDTLRTTNFDPGGFSEYIRVPRINVDRGTFILPPMISFGEGVFIEPLACVLRGQRLAKFKPGKSVFVIGSGISGVLHIALAKASGAGKIIASDINPFRLNSAKRFGADEVLSADEVSPERVRQVNHGRLADLVIVCAGSLPAYRQGLLTVDRGGTVLCFGLLQPGVDISFPFFDFWNDGITLLPTYGGAPADILQAIELIKTHHLPLKEMITHRLPLAETGLGFKFVMEAQDSIKVVIEPHR
ncbi:MAG: zinc-binding dehydrogenase [Deltaproteobacteria bacterium]|nr:zinc-binding dehydrogenase [Deltaproteobacteria bacterium]MBM4324854.1 zinc-binding dehydrogenase [Deltaproteobacteria bacterium]